MFVYLDVLHIRIVQLDVVAAGSMDNAGRASCDVRAGVACQIAQSETALITAPF
jgi:hypothetical protein